MTNHTNLIERLNVEAEKLDELARLMTRGRSQVSQAGDLCREAASRTSTLTAEVEGLREALRTARDYVADASEGLGPIRTPAGIAMMKGDLALIDATLTKGEGDKT